MTLEEKEQELIDKYIPILIISGFVNPIIRFDINLTEGFNEDSIVINYTSIQQNQINYNKNYVQQNIILQIQGDIINQIYNELFTFCTNRNL